MCVLTTANEWKDTERQERGRHGDAEDRITRRMPEKGRRMLMLGRNKIKKVRDIKKICAKEA